MILIIDHNQQQVIYIFIIGRLSRENSICDWKYTTLWYGRKDSQDKNDWLEFSPLKRESI